MAGGGGGGMASPPDSDPLSTVTVQVKFGARTIPLAISPDSTVRELKSLLQPLTNVLPRGQKLICKGKVLADPMTLKSLQISDRSKVMLIASHGVHQGDGPIKSDTLGNLRKNINVNRNTGQATSMTIEKSRLERWRVTGIVALSECQLKVIPEDVWSCGLCARVLDVSNNFIEVVPAKIGSLASMSKLFLNANNLSDDSISWESMSCLKSLTILNLSHNHLNALPSVLGTLTSLMQLHVSNNKLKCLPADIGHLNELQVLKAGNNMIGSIPSSIGNCSSLVEVDLSSNLLDGLPETFGNLTNLKCLHLKNNGLQSLPATLFKACIQLSTLDLHGTQITNDSLRQLEGWEAFDERRRLKHQKQLDFRVGGSDGFDEGADKNDGP
uniref:LRR repeats and ubiquitin-like domain-containing protein At2g30105 n=1 Tax=Anthurium amnicola TaxID=1678845 RepID=A0A1D1Z4J0_9ARAE